MVRTSLESFYPLLHLLLALYPLLELLLLNLLAELLALTLSLCLFTLLDVGSLVE